MIDRRLIALAAVGAGAALFFLGRCTAPRLVPLPPAVQKNVDRHVAQKAADSATIAILEADTLEKHRRIDTLTSQRSQADTEAQISSARADSSAARAAQATTARNSAELWHIAYVDRTHEADAYQRALLLETSKALLLADQKGKAATIAGLYHSEAKLGDVIISQLVPLAEEGDHCRILWAFHCPSRGKAFLGGVLVTAGGYELGRAIASGRVRLPLPRL